MPHNHVISLKKLPPQEPPRIPEPPVMPKKKSRTTLYIVLMLIFLAALASGVWKFRVLHKFHPLGTNAPATDTKNDTGDLVSEVGKLILLPEGEIPTIATVNDPAKYAGQAFFENAKSGDKVLIYTKAQEAYLYRPAAHVLIKVAPITDAQ